MDQRSLVLSTKIVLLLILFPLSERGSEFKFPGAVRAVTSPKLAQVEVDALKKIVSSLELAMEHDIDESFCDKDRFRISISSRCEANDTDGRHITSLIMRGLRLTGEIPADVANLTYLQELDLSNNKIHGSIPDKLGYLSNLTTLYLDQNLLSGTIPATLGNLSSLMELRLWCNQLSGYIPLELGRLSKLLLLDLDDNELIGSTPPELGNLSDLQSLWLGSNKLEGKLPKEYEKLTNLLIFSVAGNNLSGAIPPYIANWINLTDLNLIGNNFTGELPQEIFSMTNLQYLKVSGLKNPGVTFPKSANLSNIYTLILRNCNISGVIPSYISNWTNTSLQNLDLSFNNLIGEIPDGFKEQSLNRLFLTGNKLNGTFPTWIYETVQIMGDLSYNNFTFLDERDLRDNNSMNKTKINIDPKNETFAQDIMGKHCGSKKSKYHSLFINAGGEEVTTGRDHYEADNSTLNFYVSPAYNWAYSCNGNFFDKNITSSDFISNPKSGFSVSSQDAALYSKARLCPQSLIYYGFCLRNGPYHVILHFYEIVFSSNEDLSISGKRMFDIYIQGKLQRKDFNIKEKGGPNKSLTESFTVHVHDNLLKIELFWDGKGSLYQPHSLNGPLISAISVTPNFKVGGLSKTEIAGIVLAAVLAPLVLLALMWRMGWLGDRELRVNKVMLRGKSYTIKQVKDATRNFSSKHKIGEGHFGKVYKAELSDQIVAVKKLSPQSKQQIDQIGTEVYTLKQLDENDNVVKLLDCYSSKDLNLLIYEYMEKGSLQRALFDPNSDMELDWPTRIGICLGIAKGLKYLHEDRKSSKIIHRNIKPSNVLLDGNLNAKVADFGLAKLCDEENPYKFIQEKGTAVYMAPEYAMRKAITDKVDVYSFGIVMLEIVSRQANAKYDENQEAVFLLDRAIVLHSKGSLFDLVDTNIPNMNRDVRKQAIEVLELAVKCVNQSPTLRPTTSEVVSELEKISFLYRSAQGEE